MKSKTPIVYHYPKCATCRKALRFLDDHEVEYEAVDIVQSPPSEQELARAQRLSGLPISKLFNTAGQSYRDGGYRERIPKLTTEQAIKELAADGKLIKRPIVLASDYALVGFDEKAYASRFG